MLSITGEEENKRRRQLCYWDANLYLICYNVDNRDSFMNAEKKVKHSAMTCMSCFFDCLQRLFKPPVIKLLQYNMNS